jgi:predicted DNA-binding transcriptional regulator YafY
VEPLGDGSGIITFEVHDTLHLRAWIMMWDSEIEVLAPQKLREEIRNTAKSLAELYQFSQPLPATGAI